MPIIEPGVRLYEEDSVCEIGRVVRGVCVGGGGAGALGAAGNTRGTGAE